MIDLAGHKQEAKIDVHAAERLAVVIMAYRTTRYPRPSGNVDPLDVSKRSLHMFPRVSATQEPVVSVVFFHLYTICRAYMNGSAAKQ